MTKPNLFVIGAQRCGTTALCNQLDGHPDVFISSPKEPSFFTRDRDDLSGYESLFLGTRAEKVIGEGSTRYSQAGTFPGVARRIASYSPGASIIYLVRDPIDRIQSAWVQYRSEAFVKVSDDFEEALRTSPELIDASRYEYQLGEYEREFPSSQIMVIFFEEFARDPARVLRQLSSFLGIEPLPPGEAIDTNPSHGKLADRSALRLVRILRLDRPARRLLAPSGRPRRVGRGFLKVGIVKPTLAESELQHLRALLQPESSSLLARFGRPTSIWPTTFGPTYPR